MPVPGIPTPIAFLKILALNNTCLLYTSGDGQRVNASVVEIKPDVVVVDLNHPLAGADLIFEGEIIESLSLIHILASWKGPIQSRAPR